MKTLFIPAYSKLKVNKSEISKLKLPKNIALLYSIQYEQQAEEIKKILQPKYNITAFSQVLGCSKPKLPRTTKAILLIGDGRFHAVSLALETNLPTYIYNRALTRIPEKEIKQMNQRKKATYVNYLNSDKIGILVSTKPGQQNLASARAFKKTLKNKTPYILIGNNLNTKEFENFPDIQSWVNTACPRLTFDSSGIVNLSEIKS